MERKLRVAAYCRVSTDREDQTNSLASQRRYFQDYITQHKDWELWEIYFDEGISGTQTRKRAGFNHMVEDAFHGEIDLILTKEVSRFARNTVDTLSFTRRLKAVGVGVIFTIDNIDTRDSDGELRLTIMASIAQEESRKTSERVKWGQKRRMEQGVVFGRDLLGYTVQDGKLFLNKEEAAVVERIFRKYANEGKGTYVIARELTEEGICPKRGKIWTSAAILKILKNEKYVGDLCQKKTYTPDYLSHAKKYNRGQEEMICLSDHHEGIIGRELWNRTQAELARRSAAGKSRTRHSSRCWCSGKLFCGECSCSFVCRTRKLQNGGVYQCWRCSSCAGCGRRKETADGALIRCRNRTVNERTLLFAMGFCINCIKVDRQQLKQEILTEIAKVSLKCRQDSEEVEHVQRQIQVLYEKKKRTIDLLLEGLITKEELAEQNQWYDEEIRKLESRKNGVGSNEKIHTLQVSEPEKYEMILEEILRLKSNPVQVYKEVLEKMILYRGNIMHIYLKALPFGIRLEVRNSGKMETYTTEVLNIELLPESISDSPGDGMGKIPLLWSDARRTAVSEYQDI